MTNEPDTGPLSEADVLASIGGWRIGCEIEQENRYIVSKCDVAGYLAIRKHYAPVTPEGDPAWQLTDIGLRRLASIGTSEQFCDAVNMRDWYRANASKPAPPQSPGLREALESLVAAVGNMKVPQTTADVALMMTVTLGPAYERAKEALAKFPFPSALAAPSPVLPPSGVDRLRGSMNAQWMYDPEAEAYYFAPMQAAPGPYLTQRHVDAILDIASDGTLAGVELIDNVPPPPIAALSVGLPPSGVAITPYEEVARIHGWNLIPDDKGGRFERCASDEPECVWLCGDWKGLCEFADIYVGADPVFLPPTKAECKSLSRKVSDFILEIDPFGDRFSRREIDIVERALSASVAGEATELSDKTPVCCYCDHDLSCDHCGMEQPSDFGALRRPKSPALDPGTVEACAKVLDDAAQDWNRIRDPGMANNARSYAKRIRALASPAPGNADQECTFPKCNCPGSALDPVCKQERACK